MSSIPQITDNGNSVSDFATKFMKRFHISRLLFKCNAGKEKGIPVMDIFRYLFCMMFSGRSIYMQIKTGTFEGAFSKNTIYRFLNDARINWQRFTVLLSTEIICRFMKPLTDEKRKDVFIVDDSLFDRSRSKRVEMLARVFDHCSMKYRSGFRMLTLGWPDGNSFIPVSYSLLSAAEDKNLLCGGKQYDGRSLAGRRRRQSRHKATDVMAELIHSAQCAGITAKYVLFDSWFSPPKTILELKKQEHPDTIAMVKKARQNTGTRAKGTTSRISTAATGSAGDVPAIFCPYPFSGGLNGGIKTGWKRFCSKNKLFYSTSGGIRVYSQ